MKTRTINGDIWIKAEPMKQDIIGDIFIFLFILSWVLGFLIAFGDLLKGGLV